MILITSTGELLLYFTVIFFSFKKKKVVAGLFLGILAFAAGIHFQWIKNYEGNQFRLCGKIDCDQMENLEGKQYSQYTMEGNPSAYMSMRDYINQSWQS